MERIGEDGVGARMRWFVKPVGLAQVEEFCAKQGKVMVQTSARRIVRNDCILTTQNFLERFEDAVARDEKKALYIAMYPTIRSTNRC